MVAAVAVAVAQVVWPCEEIVVLSHDAKYIVMDGDTLEVVDVGNLRWQGVWGVDVVLPGSTSKRLAFVSDRLSGGEPETTAGDRAAKSALVAIGNLTEADDTAMAMAVSREYDFEIGNAWWIQGTDELLVWQQQRSTLSVLDRSLVRTDEWTVSRAGSRAIMACRNDGRLIVGRRNDRIVRDKEAFLVEALVNPQGMEDCRMESVSLGCLATLGCRSDDGYEKGIVDIASNRVVARMRLSNLVGKGASVERSGNRTYMGSVALFAGGLRLLRQSEIWVPDPAGSTSSFRVDPGTVLRVLDTSTGVEVAANNNAPSGTVSRVFCREGRERVVLSGNGRLHLVDLTTLRPIASAAIPFGRYFVF